MPNREHENRPHLVVPGTARTEPYTPPPRGGKEFRLPDRNRNSHGGQLLAQLNHLRQEAEEIGQERQAVGADIGNGILLQFESDPGFDLKVESLELSRSGIELFAVKQENEKTIATVYVPEGKISRFERLVTDYTQKETRTGKPKNRNLVESIAGIHRAVLQALWTDDPASFPSSDTEEIWWEIWLRVSNDRDAFLNFFRDYGSQLGLLIGSEEIRFPDRTVIAARGNKVQLSASVNLLNCIAEVRKAKETADFFISLTAQEQHDWIEDARRRTSYASDNNLAVCILDTGVNNQHPLLQRCLDSSDMHSYDPNWDVTDHYGHGTEMAGLALYGDLTELLGSSEPATVGHILESVKILPPVGQNQPHLYGAITIEAIARAEISAPHRQRVISLSVTTTDFRDRGQPSAWSAALDAASSGADDEQRRLIVVSAGNTDRQSRHLYPDSNYTDAVHDPGQAWNALTVGAYTEKTSIDGNQYPNWSCVAPPGDVSPASCTSTIWQRPWPIKPDIVLEGGNMATNPQTGDADYIDSLLLLSTYYRHTIRPLVATGDTSAATALAARLAIMLQAEYPRFWPETIRGLLVHSAKWTDAMKARVGPLDQRRNVETLLRYCGFGVPDFNEARWSARNSLTLIAQDSLQPFDKIEGSVKSRDMNIHSIPWPSEILQELGESPVEMRVTLSYFIEPNPARRGWTRRYRYASHGLRFDVKTPTESLDDFRRRINQVARDEELGRTSSSDAANWHLGPNLRGLGSLHSDWWSGTAAALADRGYIAVYPVIGWWRERHQLERWGKRARYALIVSIKAPETNVDIYSVVSNLVASQIQV